MAGYFITFEGTEGGGKSTQIALLAKRLQQQSAKAVRVLREPGGTPIGEEIRRILKETNPNRVMTPEAELLLMNASRAQLVREVIRPALQAGETVLCDRFYDSTVAYQGYGRGLDLKFVQAVVDFAVGDLRPDLTILLHVPVNVSTARRESRQAKAIEAPDRIEESGREFFERVEKGFLRIAQSEPQRVKLIDATASIEEVSSRIWKHVEPLVSLK